jgi:outer membrane receptor for ferric coprogen and ferric-rhodotorulic acid
LNVNNLFDKKYYDNVGFYNGVYWGDPRTVTLSLDWTL